MNKTSFCEREILICTLDEVRLGVDVSRVERVVRSVRLTPVPGATPNVEGVVRAGSRILPVVSLRSRFGLPPREISVTDYLVLIQSQWGALFLRVDDVEGLARLSPDEMVPLDEALFGQEAPEAAMGGAAGIILLQDADRLLPREEHERLNDMAGEAP